ncbi:MAG: uracil phosphoribosyltransferase [Bacteroidota bacterium]
MINNLSEYNSYINQILFELRDKEIQKDRSKFRRNLEKLGSIMAYEVSKTLSYRAEKMETPLAPLTLQLPESPVIAGVLRAAVPFMNGFISVFDHADAGFIGAYRRENRENIEIDLNYMALPSTEDRVVIVVDPMLATGKSLVKAIDEIKKLGQARSFHLVCAIATPEGIDYISGRLKNNQYTIWAAAVDSHLDANSYIVPGLGDAGDLSYGEKLTL